MHGHSHTHGAEHDHHHAHAHTKFGAAFAIGIALNLGFVVVEGVYGLVANSMALIADAGHNFSDVLGLAMAWGAAILVQRKPSQRFTYGLRSSSILAALTNAVLLLISAGAIAIEAFQRFLEPSPVAADTVIIVAAIGIAVNTITALLFMSGRKGDLNVRGAFLHMAADAAVSAGVVIAGFAIMATGWQRIDPLVSLAIVAVIVWGTWDLLRDALAMSLQGVPANVDAAAVRAFLSGNPGVKEVHDLHIWAMSTTETALTCHLVMPGGFPGDDALMLMTTELRDRFAIPHATLQVETGHETECALASDDVV
jgi:cobalt-zinc-cadmium efflux system protein